MVDWFEKGSGQTIISIISINLRLFGASSRITWVSHVASYGILQLSKNRIVFLEIGDLENSIVLNSLFESRNIFVLSTIPILIDRVVKNVFTQAILLPRIERIEGSCPVHLLSFLIFSKMFLRISMDAVLNCDRLDSHSDYSFITNN